MIRKITLTQIAKLAGVSQPTVSAILCGNKVNNSKFSAKTEKRVRQIAAEHGFLPNQAARSLLTGRHYAIGVLVRHTGMIPQESLQQLMITAREMGLYLVFDLVQPEGMPRLLLEDAVDGFLIFENLRDDIEERLRQLRIPMVHINASLDEAGAYAVNADESGGMELAIKLLASRDKGHPLLLLQGTSPLDRQREHGFTEACREAGISGYRVSTLPSRDNASDVEFMRNLHASVCSQLDQDPQIDAVIANIPLTAAAVYQVCKERSLSIPEDVAVISMRYSEMCTVMTPSLTTIQVNYRQMVIQGFQLIQELISGNKPAQEQLITPYEVFRRSSC